MDEQLHMAIEVRAWLNELRIADPARSRLAAQAVLALLDEGSALGPPLLVEAGTLMQARGPGDRLDRASQRQLELLARVRRGVADVATSGKRLQLQVGQLETQAAKLADQHDKAVDAGRDDVAKEAAVRRSAVQGQLAEKHGQLARLRTSEEKLTVASQRLQAKVDAFRTRKETVKAGYTAARSAQEISEVAAVPGDQAASAGPPDASAQDAIIAAWREVEELLASGRAAEREVGVVPREPPQADGSPAAGLMELRPGAPGDSGMRFLLAVAPRGIPALLAAGEVPGVTWYEHEVPVAGARLRSLAQTRPRPASEGLVTSFTSYDREAFLSEFCPGEAAEAQAGAAALAERNRARRLAELRRGIGLTQAQVAERMHAHHERVAEIESAEPGALEVGELAAYVAALGGRLDLIADFGAEQVVLRGRQNAPS